MGPLRKFIGIGTRIAAGFVVMLVLMASLAVIGLRHISETNARLKGIVENNNVKTELANTMQNALRERALSMHVLSVMNDPFDRDIEVQRFNSMGAIYVNARQRLEELPLSKDEDEILSRIRVLTRQAQPEVQAVVDMAQTTNSSEEMFDRIRKFAIPRQREIADQVNVLIRLQQELTAQAVKSAEASYREVKELMFLLGTSALTIGLIITIFVSLRVSRQAKQLATQALYDPLTSLPNRNLLQDRLEQAIAQSRRNKHPFGIALMDLDRFKEVNDTLGHDVGDVLLTEVGLRLKQVVREEDTVARMGGDEFVVVLHSFSETDVSKFAEKILAVMEAPFIWNEQNIDLGVSIGFSLFPMHATDAGSLVRYADIAMYAAKRSDQGYALYTRDQELVQLSDLTLKGELREAIQMNRLTLHYQPIIDHLSNRIIGLEALARWEHPERGMLSPDTFIPIVEEAGLIGPFTEWLLRVSLNHLAELHEQGYRLTMAVNLSARSLHDLELPGMVASQLVESKMQAKYLTLEITESAVMSNLRDGLEILTTLDRMGITLAIDDFGTGYSSLTQLKQLPVDKIKIDKSFVMDMEKNENDAVIVRSTIELAHNLGLKVSAEGVETREAWDMLTLLGCDFSQGYYMGRPIPADRLFDWLAASSWSTGRAEPRPEAKVLG